MAFCGQCSTLLASGTTHCPHCGAITEPEIDTRPVEDFDTDKSTIASSLSNLAPGGSRPAVQLALSQSTLIAPSS
jgi:RNA polymerase subunit RPABC4/transcription elongation factor Spt4